MGGNIAPINKITQLVNKYKSLSIIDDAHGIGILGKTGKGICEEANIKQNQFCCLILPLGKSFNGIGAIVCGRSETIENILQFAKGYTYTTSLPPAVTSALQESLSIVKNENWRRDKLTENIKYFIQYANERNIPLLSYDETPIKVIIIGSNSKTMYLRNQLMKKGLFLAAIRPPTVPENTSRLRISLNCAHTKSEIKLLLDCIQEEIS